MATKKKATPTKTLSFRIDASIYDKIMSSIKARQMSLAEYMIASVDPNSELGGFLEMEQSKIIARNEVVQAAMVDFFTGLVNLKETNNLDNQQFETAVKESFSNLVQNKAGLSNK